MEFAYILKGYNQELYVRWNYLHYEYASTFKTFTNTYSFSEEEKEVYDAVEGGYIETLRGLLQNRQEKNPIIVRSNTSGK